MSKLYMWLLSLVVLSVLLQLLCPTPDLESFVDATALVGGARSTHRDARRSVNDAVSAAKGDFKRMTRKFLGIHL